MTFLHENATEQNAEKRSKWTGNWSRLQPAQANPQEVLWGCQKVLGARELLIVHKAARKKRIAADNNICQFNDSGTPGTRGRDTKTIKLR